MNNFYDYGNALKELLKLAYDGTVVYDTASNSFEYALNQTKNKIKFPMIAFYHQPDIDIEQGRNSFPSYTRGKLFEKSILNRNDNMKQSGERNEKISKSVQNLYITMKYIIDVYGTDRFSTEKVLQELLFWLYSNQEIEFTYNNKKLKFTFEISPNIIDNTDLSTYHSNGKLYRMSISILSHVALFRSVDYFNALKTDINITVGTENK